MCDCEDKGLDLTTPKNVYLSPLYKRSFAHHTVKNRMPIILTQTIDGLVRSKEEIVKNYGLISAEDLKFVIGELSKLKYEIQTDKSLTKMNSSARDITFYNNYITTQMNKEGNITFFSTRWLLSECYMYRRIWQAFEKTNTLKEYDPFVKQKKESFFQALPIMIALSQYLLPILENGASSEKQHFIQLLKINLWGNKCDLSLSHGIVKNDDIINSFDVEKLNENILSDHSDEIWCAITNDKATIIDIICDNFGYELFTDFCIADYLISKHLCSSVRFHVKAMPWFISDAMIKDVNWMIFYFENEENLFLKKLGDRWSNYLRNTKWVLEANEFWTLPVDFSYMPTINPNLYALLAESDLLIFKGDLNYRKLFGEINWEYTTPIQEALQNFRPTKLCTLRTIKADIVCGLSQGQAEKIDAVDTKWMETGDFGLIQFSDK